MILVLNPNTSESITLRLSQHIDDEIERCKQIDAYPLNAANVEGFKNCIATTVSFGAPYIKDEQGYAVAGHAALAKLSEHLLKTNVNKQLDAILVCCFGDPGVYAIRERVSEFCQPFPAIPVIGLTEASILDALFRTTTSPSKSKAVSISLITGGLKWKPILHRVVRNIGVDSDQASITIRTITLTGDRFKTDLEGAIMQLAVECDRAAEEDAANAIVLGGAAVCGLTDRVEDKLKMLRGSKDIPIVIDSVSAGARVAYRLGKEYRKEMEVDQPRRQASLAKL